MKKYYAELFVEKQFYSSHPTTQYHPHTHYIDIMCVYTFRFHPPPHPPKPTTNPPRMVIFIVIIVLVVVLSTFIYIH